MQLVFDGPSLVVHNTTSAQAAFHARSRAIMRYQCERNRRSRSFSQGLCWCFQRLLSLVRDPTPTGSFFNPFFTARLLVAAETGAQLHSLIIRIFLLTVLPFAGHFILFSAALFTFLKGSLARYGGNTCTNTTSYQFKCSFSVYLALPNLPREARTTWCTSRNTC